MEEKKEIMNEELPMNWWNFWKYFRFPVGIFFSIFNFIGSLSLLKDVQLNMFGKVILLINFVLIIFLCITFYYFAARKKYGFEMLITYSIVEIIFNSFINVFNNNYIRSNSITELVIETLIISGIVCAIWVYPNYIYFKKRRHLFEESEENKDTYTENLNDNISEEIEEKKEEKKNEIVENKKFCTKCGKQIENDWMFCNYCGNRLK